MRLTRLVARDLYRNKQISTIYYLSQIVREVVCPFYLFLCLSASCRPFPQISTWFRLFRQNHQEHGHDLVNPIQVCENMSCGVAVWR